ncbi:MAG: hypothetical protein R3F11_26225 [Verrucomicrobiales bacterium]
MPGEATIQGGTGASCLLHPPQVDRFAACLGRRLAIIRRPEHGSVIHRSGGLASGSTRVRDETASVHSLEISSNFFWVAALGFAAKRTAWKVAAAVKASAAAAAGSTNPIGRGEDRNDPGGSEGAAQAAAAARDPTVRVGRHARFLRLRRAQLSAELDDQSVQEADGEEGAQILRRVARGIQSHAVP